MSVQQIVTPSKIESELSKIWDQLAQNNKTRACLFNLIVYAKLDQRINYLRYVVQTIVEKFPCRILFISGDPDQQKEYLKTAVSVLPASSEENSPFACDNIDIGMAGKDYERVPFLILPHIIPDLPVYLVWSEDPSLNNPLFTKLEPFATKVIFDSETADHLISFTKKMLEIEKKKKRPFADLNWARTESWRNLLAATFHSLTRMDALKKAKEIHITYNSVQTDFFCHLCVQSLYIQSWLASRLNWKFKTLEKQDRNFVFHYQTEHGLLTLTLSEEKIFELKPGFILSIDILCHDDQHFSFIREKEQPRQIKIQVSSKEQCELPYHFLFPESALGQSLAREVVYQETSKHYLQMMEALSKVDLP